MNVHGSERTVPPPVQHHRLRGMANTLSALAVGAALFVGFAQGLPAFSTLSASDRAELAKFVLFVAMIAGLALCWFRTLPGALLTLAAFAGFWAVHLLAGDGTRLGGVFALFPMAGALQLAAWWMARSARRGRL